MFSLAADPLSKLDKMMRKRTASSFRSGSFETSEEKKNDCDLIDRSVDEHDGQFEIVGLY